MRYKIEQHLVCEKFIEVEKTYLDEPQKKDTSDRATLAKGICLSGREARSHGRIIKAAQTIVDLEHSDVINTFHLAETIELRTISKG